MVNSRHKNGKDWDYKSEVINLNNNAVKIENTTYIIQREFGKLKIKDLIKNQIVKTGNKL